MFVESTHIDHQYKEMLVRRELQLSPWQLNKTAHEIAIPPSKCTRTHGMHAGMCIKEPSGFLLGQMTSLLLLENEVYPNVSLFVLLILMWIQCYRGMQTEQERFLK